MSKTEIKLKVCLLSMLFLFSISVMAQERDFISLETNDWEASVFGDVGGDEIITSENFEISQNNEIFTMASLNNRGKLSSSTDGLAYLYQSIPSGVDFEMTVTVEVVSYEMNNQVSFGIMLRDTVYKNKTTKENLGSYLAVGPINITKEPAMTVFYRTMEEKKKQVAPLTYSSKPSTGSTYELSFIKEGDTYTLTFGDEDPYTIDDLTIFKGTNRYIGLYTSRNTRVRFSDVSLEIVE